MMFKRLTKNIAWQYTIQKQKERACSSTLMLKCDLLTQAGKQFAENYPEHAGLLNIDSIKERDPHVERLLEGVAYLNANIHKRLDESLPEVSEQVLRQLCPALLNFYPSTTVFQFTPKFSMQDSLQVE